LVVDSKGDLTQVAVAPSELTVGTIGTNVFPKSFVNEWKRTFL
jgi:hypothetical protein